MSQEHIAKALSEHQWYDATTDNEDPATGCTGCDDWYGSEDALDDGTFAAHQAAVLAPLFAAAQAEARAEALAEVAEDALAGLRECCPGEVLAIGFMSGYSEAARDHADNLTT